MCAALNYPRIRQTLWENFEASWENSTYGVADQSAPEEVEELLP